MTRCRRFVRADAIGRDETPARGSLMPPVSAMLDTGATRTIAAPTRRKRRWARRSARSRASGRRRRAARTVSRSDGITVPHRRAPRGAAEAASVRCNEGGLDGEHAFSTAKGPKCVSARPHATRRAAARNGEEERRTRPCPASAIRVPCVPERRRERTERQRPATASMRAQPSGISRPRSCGSTFASPVASTDAAS